MVPYVPLWSPAKIGGKKYTMEQQTTSIVKKYGGLEFVDLIFTISLNRVDNNVSVISGK